MYLAAGGEVGCRMNKFDKDNQCPQCDSAGAGIKYHEAAKSGLTISNCANGPHMHRTCAVCGYQWSEEPLGDS